MGASRSLAVSNYQYQSSINNYLLPLTNYQSPMPNPQCPIPNPPCPIPPSLLNPIPKFRQPNP
ncbi:MAG: hypothetical protein AAF630_07770 [Cyanobacteria bacterium P01_C01_bin.38]